MISVPLLALNSIRWWSPSLAQTSSDSRTPDPTAYLIFHSDEQQASQNKHVHIQLLIAALSYKSISSHYSLRFLRLPFLTPIFFITHVQSICKPHQSALKTSWTWPFTTTSFFQAIIFLNLGDYNHFLPRLPASSHYPPWSLLSISARWPFQSFYHFMPCLWLKTLQWLPKAFKTQHDLTLPILALSSSVLPLSFSAPATPPLFTNWPGWLLPLGLCARFSLWKCPPCRPPYGCLPPFIQESSEKPSLPTSISLSCLIFFLSFFDITQLASLFISTVYFFPLNHVPWEPCLFWSRQDLTTELVM